MRKTISTIEFGYTAEQAYNTVSLKMKSSMNPNAIDCKHGMTELLMPNITPDERLQREGEYDVNNPLPAHIWVLDEMRVNGIEDTIYNDYDKFKGIACINLGWHEWNLITIKQTLISTPDSNAVRFGVCTSEEPYFSMKSVKLSDELKNFARRESGSNHVQSEIWQLDNKNEKVKQIFIFQYGEHIVSNINPKPKGSRPLNVYWFCSKV